MRRSNPVRLLVAAAIAMVAALPASAAVQVPTSGWNWSNPQPQGRTINDISAVDANTAYAGGEFGALIATADAGATWTAIPTGTISRLTHVQANGSGTLTYTTDCDVFRTDDGGATIRRMPFRASQIACGNPVSAIAFRTASSGLILSLDGTIFATNDGGRSFSRRAPIPETSVATPANDLATSVATPGLGLAVTAGGRVFRTTDDGVTWNQVYAAGASLLSITFADATTAYAVGVGTAVHKSTDAGATWTKLPTEPTGVSLMNGVHCANATTCVMSTQGSATVRTSDGGATFATVATPRAVNAAALLSTTRAVALGELGATVVSDDAGTTWRQLGRRLGAQMVGLRANPDGFAYVWGPAGALATSSDGGATWKEPGIATAAAVRAVSFATPDVGYAIDRAGVTFKTANGGTSWQILDVGTDFAPIDVFAVTAERVVLLGAGGALRRSTDGGQTFSIAGTTATRLIARRGDRTGSMIVLYGQRAIALSTHAGRTWRIVNGPADGRTRLLMRTAHCPGALTCWAVTTRNRVFRTVNAGRRWTEVSASVGKKFIAGAQFANRNTGYLILAGNFDLTQPDSGGWLLRTGDGGRTWIPQRVSSGQLQLASGGGRDYALDGEGHVFTTTTAGQAGKTSGLTFRVSAPVVRRGTPVTITGRLTPAQGGERIVISTSDGRARAMIANAQGVFTTTLLVTRTTSFVAHWGGDASRTGAGSRAVTVRVR